MFSRKRQDVFLFFVQNIFSFVQIFLIYQQTFLQFCPSSFLKFRLYSIQNDKKSATTFCELKDNHYLCTAFFKLIV